MKLQLGDQFLSHYTDLFYTIVEILPDGTVKCSVCDVGRAHRIETLVGDAAHTFALRTHFVNVSDFNDLELLIWGIYESTR